MAILKSISFQFQDVLIGKEATIQVRLVNLFVDEGIDLQNMEEYLRVTF